MKFAVYFSSIILILLSCGKNNPDPSWIEVGEWVLEENPNAVIPAGELSQNITEAFLYIDDDIVGVFEVPFKIPVLKDGAVNIKIFPAIKNNGIAATKKIYPFLEVFELNGTLVKNQTLAISPKTRYKSNVKFIIEDFEDAAIKIENDPNSAAVYSVGNDPEILGLYNGNFYCRVNLTPEDSTWIAYTNFASINGANLPRQSEVYLEIDFYNTTPVVCGLLAISASSGVKPNQHVQLNSLKPENLKWRKIYIELKEIINASDPQAYFEHSFQAQLPDGETMGLIILDNIKVVHF
jgi:hypothetical protein